MADKGLFITLEGIDGCGKSTQAELLADYFSENNVDFISVREPGGNPTSEAIRNLLLDDLTSDIDSSCELLLYEAARAQLVSKVIRPALIAGKCVLCDRFYDSTTAYQSGGRNIDIDKVVAANAIGSLGLDPDITFLFDIDPSISYARACEGGADRMEAAGLDFQERVRNCYLEIAKQNTSRFVVIDASGTPEEIFEEVKNYLTNERFNNVQSA